MEATIRSVKQHGCDEGETYRLRAPYWHTGKQAMQC